MSKELEKAIRHFECMRDDNIVVLNSGFGTKEGESNLIYRNRKKYAELAIEALEKQIPKNPYIWGDGYYNGELILDMYDCPNCEKSYEIECDKYNYCPNCGQKLDLSEVE